MDSLWCQYFPSEWYIRAEIYKQSEAKPRWRQKYLFMHNKITGKSHVDSVSDLNLRNCDNSDSDFLVSSGNNNGENSGSKRPSV